MRADTRLRRPLWVIYLALAVVAAGMAADSRAEDVATAEFSYLPSGAPMPPVYQVAGMTFFAHGASGDGGPRIVDQGTPSERGYGFPDAGVTVVLPAAAEIVEVRACLFAGAVTIESLSATAG